MWTERCSCAPQCVTCILGHVTQRRLWILVAGSKKQALKGFIKMASRQGVWPVNESVPESGVFCPFLFLARKRNCSILSVTMFLFFSQITCIKLTLICTRVSLSNCPYRGLGASSLAHVYLALGGGINWLSACWLWFLQEVVAHWIAECRLSIEQARLLTLKTANKLDMLGNRKARKEVSFFLAALS